MENSVILGEKEIDGAWYPVYAICNDDSDVNYPDSHIFGPIPDRLKQKKDMD